MILNQQQYPAIFNELHKRHLQYVPQPEAASTSEAQYLATRRCSCSSRQVCGLPSLTTPPEPVREQADKPLQMSAAMQTKGCIMLQ